MIFAHEVLCFAFSVWVLVSTHTHTLTHPKPRNRTRERETRSRYPSPKIKQKSRLSNHVFWKFMCMHVYTYRSLLLFFSFFSFGFSFTCRLFKSSLFFSVRSLSPFYALLLSLSIELCKKLKWNKTKTKNARTHTHSLLIIIIISIATATTNATITIRSRYLLLFDVKCCRSLYFTIPMFCCWILFCFCLSFHDLTLNAVRKSFRLAHLKQVRNLIENRSWIVLSSIAIFHHSPFRDKALHISAVDMGKHLVNIHHPEFITFKVNPLCKSIFIVLIDMAFCLFSHYQCNIGNRVCSWSEGEQL